MVLEITLVWNRSVSLFYIDFQYFLLFCLVQSIKELILSPTGIWHKHSKGFLLLLLRCIIQHYGILSKQLLKIILRLLCNFIINRLYSHAAFVILIFFEAATESSNFDQPLDIFIMIDKFILMFPKSYNRLSLFLSIWYIQCVFKLYGEKLFVWVSCFHSYFH